MTTARPLALEALRIGESTCLFRPENQATCLVNPTAAAILADIALGCDEPSIVQRLAATASLPIAAARRHVRALHQSARAAGLIGPLALPSEGVARLVAGRLEGSAATFGLGNDRAVTIAIADAPLRALVTAVLAPLQAGPCAGQMQRIHADRLPDGFMVALDDCPIACRADRASARRAILQAALLAMYPGERVAAILHASAIATAGRAVLLAGATGAGKTTLMLALISAGAGYLADDFTPLDRAGASVGAFPVAASVKSGSWPVAATSYPALSKAETFRLGGRQVRYLNLSAHCRDRLDGRAPAAIVFPRYAPDATAAVDRLAPEEAFRRLVEGGSAPVGSRPSMEPIVELARNVPAYALSYADAAEAARIVTGLARQT